MKPCLHTHPRSRNASRPLWTSLQVFLLCTSAVGEEQTLAGTRMERNCCCSWDSQTRHHRRLGQQAEQMPTCLTGLQKAPAQPQPSAQHPPPPLLPQSWDTLRVPRGNSSITATGPQGHAAEPFPSQALGTRFWGCSAQHLLPPVLHPSQHKVIYPSARKAKPSCSSDAARPGIPAPEGRVPPRQSRHRGRAAAQASARVKVSQRRRASRCHWVSRSLLEIVHSRL